MRVTQEIIDEFDDRGFCRGRGRKLLLNKPEVWDPARENVEWEGGALMVEPWIEGFEKWNSNSGWETREGEHGWLLSLSHWSYEATGGRYLLCDLQGGRMGFG